MTHFQPWLKLLFVVSERFNLNSFESLHGDSQGFQITCLCQFMKIPYQKKRVVVVAFLFCLCDLSECLLFLFGICYLQTTVIILTMNKNCLYVYK